MKLLKSKSLVLIFCLLGMMTTASVVIYGIITVNYVISKEDLKFVDVRLTDDPYIQSFGARKNRISCLVLSVDQFQGYVLKVREENFSEAELSFILRMIKSKDSLEIGLLKEDYKLLNSSNRSWGLLEGFSNFHSLNTMELHHLKFNGKQLLNRDEIHYEIRKSGIINIVGGGIFLLIFIAGFSEVRKIYKKEPEQNSPSEGKV